MNGTRIFLGNNFIFFLGFRIDEENTILEQWAEVKYLGFLKKVLGRNTRDPSDTRGLVKGVVKPRLLRRF
ncbi:hypothetical protein JW835_03790 [bacterium]|nr:hypothetical protein [bacterium]RQV97918.1 MAG: hypothetical protein EH221_02890 [bacterium]